MAEIKIKNFLHFDETRRAKIWDILRDEPRLNDHVYIADLIPNVPKFVRFSVGAHGVVVFLFGDDPKIGVI